MKFLTDCHMYSVKDAKFDAFYSILAIIFLSTVTI